MTPGTRVELNIDLEDLQKGMRGTIVVAKEHASIDGVITPLIWTGHYINVLGVQFDACAYPSIARMIDGKYIFVKDHCHAI